MILPTSFILLFFAQSKDCSFYSLQVDDSNVELQHWTYSDYLRAIKHTSTKSSQNTYLR